MSNRMTVPPQWFEVAPARRRRHQKALWCVTSGKSATIPDLAEYKEARRPCCYNAFMTLVEITYELQSRLQPEQLRALGSFANTYGLRRFRVDEQTNRLSFEYDASRLKETEVEHVLRQAKIPVLRRVEPVGTA